MNTTIKSTNDNSHKYGNCEICGGYCSEVYKMSTKDHSLLFGHKACLEKQCRLLYKK